MLLCCCSILNTVIADKAERFPWNHDDVLHAAIVTKQDVQVILTHAIVQPPIVNTQNLKCAQVYKYNNQSDKRVNMQPQYLDTENHNSCI